MGWMESEPNWSKSPAKISKENILGVVTEYIDSQTASSYLAIPIVWSEYM